MAEYDQMIESGLTESNDIAEFDRRLGRVVNEDMVDMQVAMMKWETRSAQAMSEPDCVDWCKATREILSKTHVSEETYQMAREESERVRQTGEDVTYELGWCKEVERVMLEARSNQEALSKWLTDFENMLDTDLECTARERCKVFVEIEARKLVQDGLMHQLEIIYSRKGASRAEVFHNLEVVMKVMRDRPPCECETIANK